MDKMCIPIQPHTVKPTEVHPITKQASFSVFTYFYSLFFFTYTIHNFESVTSVES